MRVRITLAGERAHTARPWMGRNAVHRAAPLLAALGRLRARAPARAARGCRYHEALQVVRVEGGVAGNVVPDRVELLVNHRFAPDRTPTEAEAHVREVVEPWLDLDGGDTFEVVDVAAGAAPVGRPSAHRHADRAATTSTSGPSWAGPTSPASRPWASRRPTSARATPTIAHTAGEWVTRAEIESAFAALDDLVRRGRRPGAAS